MSLHKAPDAGTGEGVFVQHVSVSGAPPGDQPEYQSDRQTSQDLVPKQTHEAKEAQQGESREGAEFSLQLLLISSAAGMHIDISTYTRFTHDSSKHIHVIMHRQKYTNIHKPRAFLYKL